MPSTASRNNSLLCTIGAMAYDDVLAGRIRDLIGPDPELTEKKMFGGLAFLIRGHMAISASGRGGVLVHVHPEIGRASCRERVW